MGSREGKESRGNGGTWGPSCAIVCHCVMLGCDMSEFDVFIESHIQHMHPQPHELPTTPSSSRSSLTALHPLRDATNVHGYQSRVLRAKADEAIQGQRCAANTYPIILLPGFQSRQSAELLSIFASSFFFPFLIGPDG